ncbi:MULTISPECIES: hypothetical protein [Mameliella]|uniref:hypothetical protein n=1 Tax=Mameliella TaxID=1434019 RepID=UPI001056034B|nr:MULTISPECIES: hypothetical protein [Mameliella]MCR9275050.1 hypothetical protein [Paracoccaceae bacterium]
MISYSPDPKAVAVLLHPLSISFAIFAFGLIGGYIAEDLLGNSMFERFGALTAGLGVLVFGFVAAELLNRSQDARFAREDDDPSDPFSVSNIRSAPNYQAFLVFVGTLQWGFGSIVMGGN